MFEKLKVVWLLNFDQIEIEINKYWTCVVLEVNDENW